MKTAYELAMERLKKEAPTVAMTDKKKKQLAELDSIYKAKIAEREIALRGEMGSAAGAGEWEKVQQLEQHLAADRQKLQAELEEKKDKVRQSKAG